MRTTVDLSDAVAREAKRIARERNTTMRALIEEGLRLVIKRSAAKQRRFRLEDHSFGSGGLVEGLVEGDWAAIRDLSYEGRGA